MLAATGAASQFGVHHGCPHDCYLIGDDAHTTSHQECQTAPLYVQECDRGQPGQEEEEEGGRKEKGKVRGGSMPCKEGVSRGVGN